MTSITIDVSDALAKIDPDKMERALEAAITGAASLIRADIKTYPPKPAHSTYIRTGRLGASWAQQVKGRQAVIGTHMAYAPYVQDADRQAWMHKGRWQTAQDVAQKRANDVKRFIETALARWAR